MLLSRAAATPRLVTSPSSSLAPPPHLPRHRVTAMSLGFTPRLATYLRGGRGAVGVVSTEAQTLWPLESCAGGTEAAAGGVLSMAEVIARWPEIAPSLSAPPPAEGVPLDDVELLAPLPLPPGNIVCVGKNYREHVAEVDSAKALKGISKAGVPAAPIIFTKAPTSVVGPGAAIQLPPPSVSSEVDYEGELAVVIGRAGRAIQRGDARGHIFGYTVANDVTARDLQRKHQQWFLGKSCDGFCPLGPWIVPATHLDVVGGPGLPIRCWVNGELRQEATTDDMIFSIEELIEVVSAGMTLRPGDILLTGTPAGVGANFKPPKFLQAGDVVRVEVEGVGELSNPVAVSASL